MTRGEAPLPLLRQGKLRRRRDGPATVIPGRIGAAPATVGGLKQRTHIRDRPGIPPSCGPPWDRTRYGRHGRQGNAGFGHGGQDTARGRRPRPENRGRGLVLKCNNPGDDLFSRKAALSVSWALESLTSVFGMGTGVASPLESPGSYASGR
jgi:hypothetical protein